MPFERQEGSFEYTPNSGTPYNVAASYNPTLFGTEADRSVAAGEKGIGSLYRRSIASDLPTYYPWDFGFDQMVQLFGGFDTSPTPVYEWVERDLFLEHEASGNPTDASDVINNKGSATYIPAPTAKFVIDAEDADIFREFDTARYEAADGYVHAWIPKGGIAEAAGGKVAITLQSEDGENLPPSAEADSRIQKTGQNLPHDLDYDPQPRSSDPSTFHTYIENPRQEMRITREMEAVVGAGATIVDLVAHYKDQLAANFRRDREVRYLNGSGKKSRITVNSGDQVYFSNGAYNQVKSINHYTASLKTNNRFDKDKFKSMVSNFVLYNFGGETGGPQLRDFYVDPVLGQYFDEAWDDIQRFEGNDFVAGVKTRRFGNTNGDMDIITVKMWSDLHPSAVRGAIRNGGSTTYGTGLLVPMDEQHVVRVYQEGLGPMEDVFYRQGGDRIKFYRMESKEGLAIKLSEHSATFLESDEVVS